MKKTIIVFENAGEAEKALAAVGGGAAVEEHSGGGDKAFFTLNVEESSASAAFERMESGEAGESAVKCPSCGSIHVEFPATPHASPTMHAVDKILEALPSDGPHFFCNSCHFTWK
jgi:hypothetical protein